MKVLGIIAEYNPFHNGHLYHLQESKKIVEADYTLCVMSGNFTQRGEPAMADKWTRAGMAVENGVDLVLELPFAFACNNAEYFAKGAVEMLHRLGCVTHLSFGSEAGNLSCLFEAASHLAAESPAFKESIKEFVDQGISFPKARYEAMRKYAGEQCAEVLKDPNNILAVEYLKQLKVLESNIIPITVKRQGTQYHEKHFVDSIGSATAIRERLQKTGCLEEVAAYIPTATYEALKTFREGRCVTYNDFFQLIVYKTLISDPDSLGQAFSATEGLENRLLGAISRAIDISSLIQEVKSKRYTATRIQRLMTHILLDLNKENFNEIVTEKIHYGRVLGFNRQGAKLLRHMKGSESNQIPIITNINKEVPVVSNLWTLLNYDILASNLYNLVSYSEIYAHSDFVKKPFKDFL